MNPPWRKPTASLSLAVILLVAACETDTSPAHDEAAERPAPAADTSSSPTRTLPFPTGWTKLPTPPETRSGTAAMAWTGEKLLVWGGYVYTGFSDETPQGDGFAFDGRSRKWERIAASPLTPRALSASAWTGEELLIWGGIPDRTSRRFLGDGAAYHPATDSWRKLPRAPIEARAPMSVWTGQELILWGTSVRVSERPRDGAAYDPVSNSWRTVSSAPIELTDATAVWTGQEMIVVGAALHGGNFPETKTAIAASYHPATDEWRRLPDTDLSPQASTAAWNGQEVVAWDYLNNSAAYDPTSDQWRTLPRVPLGEMECAPRAVTVGSYVVGDYCGALAVFDPSADGWRDITRRELPGMAFTVVAAGPAALLLGRNVDTEEEAMLAYRPPSW
jgi:N-acetylneuraminic acid mutarotase